MMPGITDSITLVHLISPVLAKYATHDRYGSAAHQNIILRIHFEMCNYECDWELEPMLTD